MKLHKALTHEVDDYLDARIKFLRHQVQLEMLGRMCKPFFFCFLLQNQQEKIKILRETKCKQ